MAAGPGGSAHLRLTAFSNERFFARHGRRAGSALIVGVGSVGSAIADALAKAGVSPLYLVDHDVLEPENLIRHALGASWLGESKALGMAAYLEQELPFCTARGWHADFLRLSEAEQRALVSSVDVVVAATDDDACQRRINEVCLAAEVAAVYPGVWADGQVRDAEVGEVQWVMPGRHTPCYECATAFRHARGGAAGRGGMDVDLGLVASSAARIVLALLDPEHAESQILNPEPGDDGLYQTLYYIHSLTPMSDHLSGIWELDLQLFGEWSTVAFPDTACHACGGSRRGLVADGGAMHPATRRAMERDLRRRGENVVSAPVSLSGADLAERAWGYFLAAAAAIVPGGFFSGFYTFNRGYGSGFALCAIAAFTAAGAMSIIEFAASQRGCARRDQLSPNWAYVLALAGGLLIWALSASDNAHGEWAPAPFGWVFPPAALALTHAGVFAYDAWQRQRIAAGGPYPAGVAASATTNLSFGTLSGTALVFLIIGAAAGGGASTGAEASSQPGNDVASQTTVVPPTAPTTEPIPASPEPRAQVLGSEGLENVGSDSPYFRIVDGEFDGWTEPYPVGSIGGVLVRNALVAGFGAVWDPSVGRSVCSEDWDEYVLAGKFRTFTATIGPDDVSDPSYRYRFDVVVDGEVRSSTTLGYGERLDLVVDISGALRLKLLTACETPGSIWALWADPTVTP